MRRKSSFNIEIREGRGGGGEGGGMDDGITFPRSLVPCRHETFEFCPKQIQILKKNYENTLKLLVS